MNASMLMTMTWMVESLDGEASGHATDKLVASDGPDGIARGLGFLNRQREFEAPFEHHLENDIELCAVGFYHVEHELTGLWTFDAGFIECEHAETDVG